MNPNLLLAEAGAHFEAGRLVEAERLFTEVLQAEPGHAGAGRMLGFLCLQQGRIDEALPLLAAALASRADPATLVNYGLALEAAGRREEALASFERALALHPDLVPALFNRANVLAALGRRADALQGLERIIALDPGLAAAHAKRGELLREMGRPQEALAALERACALAPNDAALHNASGVVLGRLGRTDEALARYTKALARDPNHAEALYNRGRALAEAGRFSDALADYDRVVARKPDFADAFFNRASVLRALERKDEALEDFSRTLALAPGHADALVGRGALLLDMGRVARALADFDAVAMVQPDHPQLVGNSFAAALHLCDWPRLETMAPAIAQAVADGNPGIPVFIAMGWRDDPALFRQCAVNVIAERIRFRPPPLWQGAPRRHRRIRLAYVSSDFRDHATSLLLARLIERHDRERFEVIGISLGADDASALGRRIKAAFDQFHGVRGKSSAEVAQLMHALEVDIALDVNGHTRDGFPEIFAHRPAPVQVNYLAFPGTMGADFMDYIIADGIVLPMSEQPLFSERIVQLPDCYQCNDDTRAIAPLAPTRAEAGLPEQGFVFACFNTNWKLSPPVFDIWMRLLAQVPGSVLWLMESDADASANLRRQAGARGIDPARLVFAKSLANEQHLARHRLADLFLDTWPYNAHTTGSDALWAGLPLVTRMGRSFPARVGASLLTAAGVPELITRTPEEYEALALELARDPERLTAIRRKLAQARDHCALFDIERYRRGIEAAYVRMWEIAERGAPPEAFAVGDLPGWQGEPSS